MLNSKKTDIAELKQYLLGALSTPDAEAIDLQLIANAGLEEDLLWAESELMEDYLEQTLSPEHTTLFEKTFLVSPERLSQLKQLALVKQYAGRYRTDGGITAEAEKEKETGSLIEKIRNFFRLNWRPAAAMATVLLIGAAVVFYFALDTQTSSEKEFAALNQGDLSDVSQLKSLSNINLMSGVFRDAGKSGGLNRAALTDKVFFRLALPSGTASPSDKFSAQLSKNGKIVFTQNDLPIYNNPGGQEIRLLLPSAALPPGQLQIKIFKQNQPEQSITYGFNVEQ